MIEKIDTDWATIKLLPMFKELVDKLQSTSGRIEKENILKEYEGNWQIKNILQFIFDPYTVTGISKKKIKKELVNYSQAQVSLFDDDGWPTISIKSLPSLLSYLRRNNTGKDNDIKTCQLFIKNNLEYKELIESIITKDLKLGVQPKTLCKVFGSDFIKMFDVMLAEKYYDNPNKWLPEDTEYSLSTKLDGIRCVCIVEENGPKFFSRQGQPFYGLVELEEEFSHFPINTVVDGELLLNKSGLASKDLYRETVKVVNADGEKKNIIFNAFDLIDLGSFQLGYCNTPCKKRKQELKELIETGKTAFGLKWIKNVEDLYQGTDQSQIQYWLDKITSEGGEGVMINISDAPYECKRTTKLLKVKKFNTADVRVIGVEEGTGVNKGRLGAIRVEFIGPDGKTYNCKAGSGFKEEERIYYWSHPEELIGKIVEINYFEITNNQNNNDYSMRFPTWQGKEYIRFDKTEISMH